MQDVDELARIAVDCGFKIHKELGPGLLESVYEALMAASLVRAGLGVGGKSRSRSSSTGWLWEKAFAPTFLSTGG